MRFLGIDYGFKKIGLALGEDVSNLVFPLDVVQNPGSIEKIAELLIKIIKQEGIEACVIGLPFPPNGGESLQLNETKKFVEYLKSQIDLPIYTEDEAYTSKESQRLKQENNWQSAEDALAAVLILEQFFTEHS